MDELLQNQTHEKTAVDKFGKYSKEAYTANATFRNRRVQGCIEAQRKLESYYYLWFLYH